MTAKEIEQRLLKLSERYLKTRDEALAVEYRALHRRWMAVRSQGVLVDAGH